MTRSVPWSPLNKTFIIRPPIYWHPRSIIKHKGCAERTQACWCSQPFPSCQCKRGRKPHNVSSGWLLNTQLRSAATLEGRRHSWESAPQQAAGEAPKRPEWLEEGLKKGGDVVPRPLRKKPSLSVQSGEFKGLLSCCYPACQFTRRPAKQTVNRQTANEKLHSVVLLIKPPRSNRRIGGNHLLEEQQHLHHQSMKPKCWAKKTQGSSEILFPHPTMFIKGRWEASRSYHNSREDKSLKFYFSDSRTSISVGVSSSAPLKAPTCTSS